MYVANNHSKNHISFQKNLHLIPHKLRVKFHSWFQFVHSAGNIVF
jgi:hypothetical protein